MLGKEVRVENQQVSNDRYYIRNYKRVGKTNKGRERVMIEEIKVERNKVIITCLLSKGTRSKSGKNLTLASTHGFVPIAETGLRLNLNIIQ